jgi:hypothetical protein
MASVRIGRVLLLLAAVLLTASPASAIKRELFRDVRAEYEGMTFRLRIDLRPANVASSPNVVNAEGVGYVRERSPVLFHRLQQVYVGRVINDGKQRIGLTIYRNADQADQYRALAIPPPALANPNASGTLAAFAQTDSTEVLIELKAKKKEPGAQRQEIETLMRRVFYIASEPTREEIEEVILSHRGASIGQLRALTGLDNDEIREILERASPGQPVPDQSK